VAWSEKAFEESMTPHIDAIYRGLFSGLTKIVRSDRSAPADSKILFMDRELSIDTFLYFKDGTVLTLQEKTRRKNILDRFGADFTFEYYNDPITKDKGEWFKLAAQLYFYGYADEHNKGYCRFWLVNVPKLRLFLKNNIGIAELERKYLRYNKPPARANFFAVPFDVIGKECIMYAGRKTA